MQRFTTASLPSSVLTWSDVSGASPAGGWYATMPQVILGFVLLAALAWGVSFVGCVVLRERAGRAALWSVVAGPVRSSNDCARVNSACRSSVLMIGTSSQDPQTSSYPRSG